MTKKISILISLSLTLFAFNSKYTPNLNKYLMNLQCDKVLHKKAFDNCYSCSKKEPNAVTYMITKEMVKAKSYIRNLYFHPDYSLSRKCRSYPDDYTHSGYDRGHNAPNAVFDYNRAIQKETFLMSNVSPQAKWLNRKYWAKVERFARYLAVKHGKVEVVTGSCGNTGFKIGSHGVNVPKWWFKIIYIPKLNLTKAFLAPNINDGMKTAPLKKYLTTIQDIKNVCGF